MRPETVPCRNSPKTALACASGRVLTSQWIFPAAARASTSRTSCLVPTEEAWMRTSNAAIKMGGKQMDSEGRPTTRSIPVGRTQGKAVS